MNVFTLNSHKSASFSGCIPSSIRTPLPLRVIQVIDAHSRVRSAGRMVISGRMADVCAELDRLAAFETACTT